MSSTCQSRWSCPSCGFQEQSAVGARRHICLVHLAYYRFACPSCRPARLFTTQEDAATHHTLEAHKGQPTVVDLPDLGAEKALRELLGAMASVPSSPPTLSPSRKRRAPDNVVVPELLTVMPSNSSGSGPTLEETMGSCEQKSGEGGDTSGAEEAGASPEEGACRLCGKTVNPLGRPIHAQIHVPKEDHAIICSLCPADSAATTAWTPSRLKIQHHEKAHSGQELKYTDRRSEMRDKFNALVAKCFPASSPSPKKGSPQEHNLSSEEENLNPADESKAEEEEEEDEDKITCLICHKRMSNSTSVYNHIGTHLRSVVKALVCKACPAESQFAASWLPQDMKNHFKKVHPDQPVSFEDHRELFRDQHADILAVVKALVCKACPAESQFAASWLPQDMKNHFKKVHPDQPVSFEDHRELFRDQHADMWQKCFGRLPGRHKGRSLKSEEVSSHDTTDLNETRRQPRPPTHNFTCQVCGDGCSNMREHIGEQHLSKPGVLCSICPSGTQGAAGKWGPASLDEHFATAHPNTGDPRKHMTDNRFELRDHMNRLLQQCFNYEHPHRSKNKDKLDESSLPPVPSTSPPPFRSEEAESAVAGLQSAEETMETGPAPADLTLDLSESMHAVLDL